jgi:hypothetical protein
VDQRKSERGQALVRAAGAHRELVDDLGSVHHPLQRRAQ